jgi:hypothetical protein
MRDDPSAAPAAGMHQDPAERAGSGDSLQHARPGTPAAGPVTVVEEDVLRAKRHAALREAFAYLTPEYQCLMSTLVDDLPMPHAGISARPGIPVGSIGPQRSRCLDKLRYSPSLAVLTGTGVSNPGRGNRHGRSVVE